MLHLVELCELAFQASCQAMTVHVLQLSATAAQAKALPHPHASNTCSERNIYLTLIAKQGQTDCNNSNCLQNTCTLSTKPVYHLELPGKVHHRQLDSS